MGFHNFASSGYAVLNSTQAGESWDLGGGAFVQFTVGDLAGQHCTMRFSRQRTDADRAQIGLGISLDAPDPSPTTQLTGFGAFVVTLVNFFNIASQLTNNQPVERSVNVFGLGYDDGHAGSRQRHIATYEQAVKDVGRGWLRQYREKLSWGGFFVESSSAWYTHGAIASESQVMLLRVDSTGTHLEISGYFDDRRANLCRIVTGHATRRGPEFRQR
jgi:hypothetical protein